MDQRDREREIERESDSSEKECPISAKGTTDTTATIARSLTTLNHPPLSLVISPSYTTAASLSLRPSAFIPKKVIFVVSQHLAEHSLLPDFGFGMVDDTASWPQPVDKRRTATA